MKFLKGKIMRINELKNKAHEHAKNVGFYDNDFNLGEKLMLIVSEIAEAMESDRKGDYVNKNVLNYINEIADDDFKKFFEFNIKDTFEDEIADAIIRLLDLCAYKNIDIEKHIELKMRYNSLRGYKHGGKKY